MVLRLMEKASSDSLEKTASCVNFTRRHKGLLSRTVCVNVGFQNKGANVRTDSFPLLWGLWWQMRDMPNYKLIVNFLLYVSYDAKLKRQQRPVVDNPSDFTRKADFLGAETTQSWGNDERRRLLCLWLPADDHWAGARGQRRRRGVNERQRLFYFWSRRQRRGSFHRNAGGKRHWRIHGGADDNVGQTLY